MTTFTQLNVRSIAATLGGKAFRDSVLAPGPGHSRKDRSLHIRFKPDGTFTVNSYAGDDWRICKDYVRERLGLSSDWRRKPANDNTTPTINLRAPDEDTDLLYRVRSALRRWETAAPIAGTLAECYLASRGLSYSGDAIRYRANDRSMVALMTDAISNAPCGVHVTYLDPEGCKIGRKMYGRARGAVVRLSLDKDITLGLAIAEGIETALAAPFRPVWACLSAGTMAAFPVLAGVEYLTVFADNDASGTGIKAAKACAERWHGARRGATIHIPTETGIDFADFAEAA
jgi:hypothetical protein